MNKNPIKNSVDGIEFAEETKNRILTGISEEKTIGRKINVSKFGVRIVACIIIIFVIGNVMMIGKPYNTEITVYAMTQEETDENTALSLGKQVILKPMETPVGQGYVFEIEIPDNYVYTCTPIDGENNIFTIYQNGKYIYWIPNQGIPGKIYNSSNEELVIDRSQYINESRFEIIVFNSKRVESKREKVEFEIAENACFVTLKE